MKLSLVFFFAVVLSSPCVAEEQSLSEIVIVFNNVEECSPLSVSLDAIQCSDCIPYEHKLAKYLLKFLCNPVDDFEEIRHGIIDFYKDKGFPFVAVNFPTGQRTFSGKLTAHLFVARVGSVKVEGARWFSKNQIAKSLTMKTGDFINTSTTTSDLAWINSNPFRDAQMTFQKGEKVGETDVSVMVKDKFPVRVYGSYINTGNIIAGDSRWVGGFSWGNAFMLGHELNYQFISADSASKWWANGVNYTAPLSWGHTFKAFGSYASIKPNITDPNISIPQERPFDQTGKGWVIGGRYIVPLPTVVHYLQNILVGFDFKRTNNFLNFSQALIFDNYIDVDQFLLGYDGRLEKSWGMLVVGATLYLSPGGMSAFNQKRFFEIEQPGARANYVYSRITADAIFSMPRSFSWALSTLFQWSSGKLLPSEQLSLGGRDSIRGYLENEIVSDRGLLVKNELRSPTFPLFLRGKTKDQLQLLGFVDFGYANDINQNILSDENKILASAGPGIRYRIEDYVVFRLDYGMQLRRISNRLFTSGHSNQMNMNLTVGF